MAKFSCLSGELSSGTEDKEKLWERYGEIDRPGDKEGACGSFLPLEDIRMVICQVTAADKLRDLNGFCDG